MEKTEEVKSAIESLSATVKDTMEKYEKNLAEERKTYEELLAKKADGKDFGEVKEKLEKIEKDTNALQEKFAKEIADIKMASSISAPHNKDEEVKSAYFEYLRTGNFDRLNEKSQNLLAQEVLQYSQKCLVSNMSKSSVEEVKGMLAGRIPDGGNLVVPPVISNAIIRMMEEDTALLRLSSSISIATDTYKRNAQLSRAEAYWVDEQTPWRETENAKYGDIKIDVNTLVANPKVSQNLIEDGAIDIEKEVMASVREAFTDVLALSCLYGNGDNKPLGLLNYPMYAQTNTKSNKRKWGEFGYIATGKAGGLRPANKDNGVSPVDDLVSLTGSLKRGYLNNATWLMNVNTATELRKLKDSNNNYIWELSLEKGIPFKLLGYPVEYEAYMPDISETDKCPVAFGDFRRGCLVVRRRGMNILRDPLTQKGQVIFSTSMRMGFGVQDFDAIKFLKSSVN